MQYQRLDPQPIVYWHEGSQMYSTGDGIQLRVLALLHGMRPVLAPEQKAPWPDAELWHDSEGDWYWRRAPAGPMFIWTIEGVRQANYSLNTLELEPCGLLNVRWDTGPLPPTRGSISYNPAGGGVRYSIPNPPHILDNI